MLRDYQKAAHESVLQSIKDKKGNPLVVIPTGGGKSHIIAENVSQCWQNWGVRSIVLQHRKELIEQNTDKIKPLVDCPVGQHSAGLNRNAVNENIILAGIQSVWRKAHLFGRRQLLIIDEAHCISEEENVRYQTFFDELKSLNPDLAIVGYTATPYRLDSGQLWGSDKTFSHVCYSADIRKLIDDGYLCPLVTKPSSLKYATENLKGRQRERFQSWRHR